MSGGDGGANDAAGLTERAARALESREPADAPSLLALGHALIDAEQPRLAAAVLQRAHAAAPGDVAVLAEHVAALELLGAHREAVAVLDEDPALVESSPLLSYLRAINGLLTGDGEPARRFAPALRGSADARIRFMAARLDRILGRLDALRRDGMSPDDERARYFALTGGLLLARPGSDGGGAHQDDDSRVREALTRAVAVLDQWGARPPVVLHPPERNCEILAHAAALLLGCPAVKWGGDQRPGMIAVYDWSLLIPEMRGWGKGHAPGQSLYVHAVDATREHAVAPDLVSLFYQRNTPAWGPGFGPGSEYLPPREGAAAEVARDVIEAPLAPGAEEDLADLLAFAGWAAGLPAELRPAALQPEGERERLFIGSARRPS